MSVLYAPISPGSRQACRFGVSSRKYDCQHCPHFHVGCRLGDQIQWALENEQYGGLPQSLKNKIYYEKARASYEDAMAIIKKWNSEKSTDER